MNELKRIENERKERERIISHDVQKFVQQQDANVLTTNNSIQRTVSSSSRRSSINQDYLQRFNNPSNRISTTQKIVRRIIEKSDLFELFLDNIRTSSWN
jgi:hypothetical protein